MKYLLLSGDKYVIVDDEDFDGQVSVNGHMMLWVTPTEKLVEGKIVKKFIYTGLFFM